MSHVTAACRQLYSIHQKLTSSLTQPPYTAGYVQQLINLSIDILEGLNGSPEVSPEVVKKAQQGLFAAQVLADSFDKMNASQRPLYEMADVLQPALDALSRFLLACQYPQEEV